VRERKEAGTTDIVRFSMRPLTFSTSSSGEPTTKLACSFAVSVYGPTWIQIRLARLRDASDMLVHERRPAFQRSRADEVRREMTKESMVDKIESILRAKEVGTHSRRERIETAYTVLTSRGVFLISHAMHTTTAMTVKSSVAGKISGMTVSPNLRRR
jgi:hypothetical protein